MLEVEIEYEKDANGYITDSFSNSYADLVAGDLLRNRQLSPRCGHTKYPSAVVHLAIDSANDAMVYVSKITNYCCTSYKEFLESNLQRVLKF